MRSRPATPLRGALLLALLLFPSSPRSLVAQTGPDPTKVRQSVRSYREANEAGILAELDSLLAIPNNASDLPNIRRNADLLVSLLSRRGIRARLLELENAPPAVYGELATPGAGRTVVLYAHYDGQPVDPSKWVTPAWKPVLRTRSLLEGGTEIPFPTAGQRVDPESRIYARSASDDKSPIIAMLAALDALQAAKVPLSVNLKFYFEGEEEAGSDHLRESLVKYADLLKADAWLFFDGPMHQSRRQQISFGVRGVSGLNLTVYGPVRPLHSGHYGNWAPNPNVLLVHLLASMRDPDGKITIAGFYDDVRPPTAAEKKAFASVPSADQQLRSELGLAETEAGDAPLTERIMLPALNLGGLSGGRTGAGGANLIGVESNAYIDFRLVPNQTPRHVRELVEAHITRQGFHIVRDTPDSATRQKYPRLVKVAWTDSGYPAFRTSMDLPASRAVLQTAEEVIGGPVIAVPTSGASLGVYHFDEVLKVPLIFVPIVNHDNNQHGENENLRIRNLWDGIELISGLMARLGINWRSTT